jgi:hypothetical protein
MLTAFTGDNFLEKVVPSPLSKTFWALMLRISTLFSLLFFFFIGFVALL